MNPLLTAAGLLGLVVALSSIGFPARAAPPARSGEVQRCGWFVNPTPGNASLIDRDGEWLISVQGGHEADGDWPDFSRGEWVRTQGSHGYGCACMRLITKPGSFEVSRIVSGEALPLKTCRDDRSIRQKPLG